MRPTSSYTLGRDGRFSGITKVLAYALDLDLGLLAESHVFDASEPPKALSDPRNLLFALVSCFLPLLVRQGAATI